MLGHSCWPSQLVFIQSRILGYSCRLSQFVFIQSNNLGYSFWLVQAYRNSVPVPRHWSQKRKYLQGKRGIEKPPFVLPDFIEATGIGQMRQAYQVNCPV